VPEFDLPPALRVRFIFPHAPYRPITINGGHVMRGWYDIAELNSQLRQEDEPGIRASACAIEALIAQQVASGIPARRIVLAGFSQGAAMALHAALRYAQPLAGIIALSGYLPLAASFAAEAHCANAGTPIFLAHGTGDNVVPLPLGESTRVLLERNKYVVTWRTYPMPHSVCAQEISDIGEFLRVAYGM
jgi:phospholipase/carboxylesterase